MMNKRQFVLCLLILLGGITAHAYDFGVNGVYYNITDADNKTVEVTYVDNSEGNVDFYYGAVTIPGRVSNDNVTYTVTAISDDAFHYCSNLTSVTVGSNVTRIGSRAFMKCTSLQSVTLPDGLLHIGYSAFDDCYVLANLDIPSTVTEIEGAAFSDCRSFTSLILPEGITTIGGCFVDNCTGIKELSIPKSVTSISPDAFYGTAFTSVYVYWETPLAIASNLFPSRNNATLYVPFGSQAAYGAADGWKDFKETGYTFSNMETWEGRYPDRFTITHDGTDNTIAFTGEADFEHLYTPIKVEAGKAYELSVDYSGPALSLLNDKDNFNILVVKEFGGTDNYSYISTTEIPSTATTGKTLKTTFRATDENLYIFMNFGYLSDGVTHTLHFDNWQLKEAEGTVLQELQKQTFTVEAVADDDYKTVSTQALDMTAIESLLGTTTPVVYSLAQNGKKTKQYNLDPFPGFWCDGEGKVTDHGNAACRIGYAFVEDHLEVYQYPCAEIDLGGDYVLYTYLVNEETGNWVTVETNVHVTPVSIALSDTKLKMTTSSEAVVPFQNVQDEPFPKAVLEPLMMSSIKQAIGTDEPVVYAMDKYGNLTKRYTLTPNPGFWMDADGKVCKFTRFEGDCHIGYAFVGDHLDIYQNPGVVKNGDTYELDIYFVNEANGNYAKHTTTVTIQSNQQVGDTFTAPVPCGDGTANLTFKVTNLSPWEVEVSASPEDIVGALTIPAKVQDETGVQFLVKAIGCEAFLRRYGLTSVVLPEGITCIWDRAFNDCENLEQVILPSTLRDIYQGAFLNCTSLSDITLPDGLTYISLATFQNTPSLKSINLPEGITTIEDNAFVASGLESITFPSTLTEVGREAFRCKGLKQIDFGRCHASFSPQDFRGCSSLEEVFIPNTVMQLGYRMFWDCTSLKKVTFEAFDSENIIGASRGTFKNCTALEEVVLSSTSLLSREVFENCKSLKSVTVLQAENSITSFPSACYGVESTQVYFTIPDNTATRFLKAGYFNLSDLSGLDMVREEFENEATDILEMANSFSFNETSNNLTTIINQARTIVNEAQDYMTVYGQIDAIKSAAKQFLVNITLQENSDVTAAVINSDFNRFAYGWNFSGYGNSLGWNSTGWCSNESITIDKFVEYWNKSTNLDDGQIAQTIKKLPAGVYRLEADIIATLQGDASAEVTGVSLFAGNAKVAVATENEKPQHFSVKFENATTRDVTIGIDVNGTNANWVAMDNVRLIYESKAAAIPESAELKSSETDTLYLYNVDADKYLSAGHAYGTHAILDETGLPVRLTQNEETGLWQIYFWEGSLRQQLLFKGNIEDVWVDYNGQSDGYPNWSITDAGDGTYLIQSSALLGTDKYLGNNPSRQDLRTSYSGYTYTDVIAEATLADNVHWQIFTKAACDMIIAKRKLMDAILRMEASGMTDGATLLSTAKTVYENDEATIKEVINITTLLNSQMGMPRLDEPIDMTALITNPRFENNTTEGWSGANAVGGRSDATSNQEQEFYEKDFSMYQVITGVPNGRYKLKWKGLHRPGSCENVYAEYKAGTDNASAVVYANDVVKTMKNWALEPGDANTGDWSQDGEYYPNSMESARRCFDAGLYADSLEVEVKDNVLTIGVKNTLPMVSAHWVVFSDFELYIMENEEQLYHKLSAEDVKCVPGVPFTYNINLTNRDEVTAFQFEMTLPEGVSIYEENGQQEVQLTNRGNGHIFSCTKKGEGNTYLFSAMSLQSKPFKKNSGALVRMTLQSTTAMELGDYNVKVKNVELSKPNGMQVLPFDFTNILTVKEADLGDVNGDGLVTVTDAVYVFRYVNGQVMPHFQTGAADVNGDKRITINDAVAIVNMILSQGQTTNARMMKRLHLER